MRDSAAKASLVLTRDSTFCGNFASRLRMMNIRAGTRTCHIAWAEQLVLLAAAGVIMQDARRADACARQCLCSPSGASSHRKPLAEPAITAAFLDWSTLQQLAGVRQLRNVAAVHQLQGMSRHDVLTELHSYCCGPCRVSKVTRQIVTGCSMV